METWATVGRKDSECWDALVLAESFRKTLTTKRLSILTGEDVSKEMRYVLGHFFDLVKPLPVGGSTKCGFHLGNLLPWSKCILVDVGCIVLENSDELFDHEKQSKTVQGNGTVLNLYGSQKSGMSVVPSAPAAIRVTTPKIVSGASNSKFAGVCASEILLKIHQMVPRIQNVVLKSAPNEVSEAHLPSQTNASPQGKPLREAIAIIGLSCRFPGANNVDEFWEILKDGRYTVTRFPEGRATFDIPGIQESVAGFLSCPIDEFDPEFFGIDPKLAWSVDPQHRILMEVAWESLEDAGIDTAHLHGTNTGVFVGNLLQDYERLLPENELVGITEEMRTLGNGLSSLSGRLSHFLDLAGPSVSHEAGCSSGLGALHLACESLLRNECNLALCGAVNLVISPRAYNTAVLSSDFKCKTFDESADGFVSGEAAGTLVLKRYEQAVKDGDRIRAIIRGTAMSNDGASLCYGTPNPEAHARTHKLALAKAGVASGEVQYVETHGTGTQKGDIGEIFGLNEAYGGNRKSPLLIGSVKQNIGHGEAAAAMGSAVKLILALEKAEIPPNIFLNKLNPKINLDVIPGIIPTERTPWTGDSRLAGLSSFSLTGSLVHAILESAPKNPENSECVRSNQVITISAKSRQALEAQRHNYVSFLKANSSVALADVAYAANACRTHFANRIALTVRTVEELIHRLQSGEYYMHAVIGDIKSREPVPHLRTAADEEVEMEELEKTCRFYVQGGDIDWAKLFGKREKRVVLPFYPFQRQKYWFNPQNFPGLMSSRNENDPTMRKVHHLLGWKIPSAIGAIFQNDDPGMPQSSSSVGKILEILIAAGKHFRDPVPPQLNLENVNILAELGGSRIQTIVETSENDHVEHQWKICLYQAREGEGWGLVASCMVNFASTSKPIAEVKRTQIVVPEADGQEVCCSPTVLAMGVSLGTTENQDAVGQISLPLVIKSCRYWAHGVGPRMHFCSGRRGMALIEDDNDCVVSLEFK